MTRACLRTATEATTGFEEYLEALQPVLDAAVAERLDSLLSDLPLTRRDQLEEALGTGKKLRGAVLCLVAEALGGDRERALPRAVAVELIHTASLIHDDLVDGDRIRRSLPAAWTLEGGRRAVLLGDLLFATALETASRMGRADGAIAAHAIARVAEGACREPLEPEVLLRAAASGSFPADAYGRIIHLKTGVLFGAACRLGAVVARAGARVAARAQRYGELLGEAYQLADDREDLPGALTSGPPEPRRMVPVAAALLCLAPETAPQVLALLRGKPLPEPDVTRLRHLAEERLATLAQRRIDDAVAALGALPAGPGTAALIHAPREILRLFRRGEARRGGP